MNYQIYTTKTYNEKYKIGIKIDSNYYTNVVILGHSFVKLGLIDNTLEFRQNMKDFIKSETLTFDDEIKMNQAKDYIEGFLIMGKLMS